VLSGRPTEAEWHDLIPVAARLIWGIDGVVDVIEKLETPTPATQQRNRHLFLRGPVPVAEQEQREQPSGEHQARGQKQRGVQA